ncbi:uncharacterized protein LOC117328272 [Pecten maximus]|uniref:uncharacterized protein LOC117328272 n=1 Tax=Pecten maximus TaxID=6579 RepID=UPI00145882E2|nr:uncharacterized protein LOC117328272 [Pecten maximus]
MICLIQSNFRVYYDYTERMAKTVAMVDGKEQISIIDYRNNVTYSIYDGVCTKNASYNEAQRLCIPDDAVFAGSQIMGSPNNSLVVNTWRITTSDLTLKVTVTNDTCTIVQESMYGNINGSPGESTYLLSDVTEGALPNGIFNIPPECRQPLTGPIVGR